MEKDASQQSTKFKSIPHRIDMWISRERERERVSQSVQNYDLEAG